jgi:hypothetical protein
MTVKTADQIRLFATIAATIVAAAAVGVAPTVWASF